MDNKKTLSIILPAFNEEENLSRIEKELIPVLCKLHYDYEVIIVDDGSIDDTQSIAKRLAMNNKNINVVSHKKNLGLGAAIQTGIINATGDILITLDSDFTFHPTQIPNLIKRFEKGDVDCIIGSPALYSEKEKIPFIRVFLSKNVNFIYAILMGRKLTAISPIFRLYKTEQLKDLQLKSNGFDINAEILFELIKKKCSVVEIPALLTVRSHGVSKINNVKEIKNHLKLIVKIAHWRLKIL